METKHTKGEWQVVDKRTIKCDQFTLAKTYANPPFPQNEREAEANAKLIAAAPELLEACQAALDYVNQWTSTNGKELSKSLQSAITKATT